MGLSDEAIAAMSPSERRRLLANELDYGTDFNHDSGLDSLAQLFTHKSVPLQQDGDSEELIIAPDPAGGGKRTYVRGYYNRSYVHGKAPSKEMVNKLLDESQPPVIVIGFNARRFFEESIKLENDNSQIGHLFQIVGYDEQWQDPFDNKQKPAFKVRDSLCRRNENCITYYTAAEEVMPLVANLSRVSKVEHK